MRTLLLMSPVGRGDSETQPRETMVKVGARTQHRIGYVDENCRS